MPFPRLRFCNRQLPTAAAFLTSNYYDMLETMYVRCTHCGYDNSPEYRFCGMCGASLAHPPVIAKTAEKPVAENGGNGHSAPAENVHGPSFLGLAEDPKVEFHYLYEDEQPRSHVGLVIFLLIIFGAAGALGWQWKHNGFPFNRLTASTSSNQSGSPSEVAPAQSQDQQTHIEKPMTGAPDVLPTQPDQKAQENTGKTTDVPIQNGKAGTPTETDIPPSGSETSASQNGSAPATQNVQQKGASSTEAGNNSPEESTQEAKATPPPPPTKSRSPKSHTAKPSPQPATSVSQATVSPGSVDSDLETAGERYLYGNGLPQNCTRAESNLRTAATHGNTKAETVLGTMYATGHCVGRDLPTAYRWFARALHQEPQNSRISDDLQVLWRQMTPQEKQLATTAGPR